MPLFKRKPKPPPPKEPDVYVSYYYDYATAIRFFFIEELRTRGSEELLEGGGTRYTTGGFRPGAWELLEEIKAAVSAAYINPHRQYIAVHWRGGSEPPADAEEVVLGLLARHFGWEEPLVEYFDYPSERKREVERLRGVSWSPSS